VCNGRGSFVQRLEHLTCFVAGNLALGVHTGAVNGTRADKYMALARNLTNTCYEMYRRMPTGASPPPFSVHKVLLIADWTPQQAVSAGGQMIKTTAERQPAHIQVILPMFKMTWIWAVISVMRFRKV
jgi:hypothetical protein